MAAKRPVAPCHLLTVEIRHDHPGREAMISSLPKSIEDRSAEAVREAGVNDPGLPAALG